MLEDPSILSSYIEQILALPKDLIEEVIREIPRDWSVPIQDREALVISYYRKKHLPIRCINLQKNMEGA